MGVNQIYSFPHTCADLMDGVPVKLSPALNNLHIEGTAPRCFRDLGVSAVSIVEHS
jgi:hypothetical protein